MPEIRVDPLTGERAIVAGERARRPGGAPSVADAPPPIDPEQDPFVEGHEDRTPPELFAVRPTGGEPNTPGWTVRVVPNLYPALTSDAPMPEPDHAAQDLFAAAPASGEHEVIVNAPQPVPLLADLDPAQLAAAMDVWAARMGHHREQGAACVHLIVNERREAGSSLPHTHAQLYALPFVPADLARERERAAAYAARTDGADLAADLVQEEVRRRVRLVAYDDEAVCLAPWASRTPYQLALFPRRPRPRFEDEDAPRGAALLHDVLNRLRRRLGNAPPLNLWVRTAPRGADRFCWRIDVVPRLTHLAGLELGAGIGLQVVAPEDAAAHLREAT